MTSGEDIYLFPTLILYLLTYSFTHSIQVHGAIDQRIQNMSKIHIIYTKDKIYTVRENEKQTKSSHSQKKYIPILR
jgi:type IV secretory pathway VirB6-like protein